MRIELVGKMNNRYQIQCPLGQITRTREDFEILQENLLLQPSGLLIPRLVKEDFPQWFRAIFDYNSDPLTNPVIRNFLTNERYFLTGRQGKVLKSVYAYLEKLDYLWTQSVNYHK